MSRKWKPGDVALVTIGRRSGDGSDESTYMAFFVGRYGWYGVAGGEGCGGLSDNEDEFVITRRPLVVIDPEDREQVDQFDVAYQSALDAAKGPDSLTDVMQAALRSLVAEPEPEEPTGLGAVVRDGKGSDWVRIYQHAYCNDWRRTDDEAGSPESTARAQWAELPRPLTILSPGWEPES